MSFQLVWLFDLNFNKKKLYILIRNVIFGIFFENFEIYDERMIVCYRDAFFSFSNKVTLKAFSIWFLQSFLEWK